MQNTQKGYILPMVLIVILLGLAGFFLFSGQGAEAPIVADDTTVRATTTPTVTDADMPDDTATMTDDDIDGDEDELTATSTASTTVDASVELE